MKQPILSPAKLQFVKFLGVGVLNTVFGYSLYALFVVASLSPEVSLALATVGGVFFNYFTTGRIVFDETSLRKIPLFLAAYGTIYVINVLPLRFLIAQELSPLLAQAILLPFITVISFLTFRHLVFRASHTS